MVDIATKYPYLNSAKGADVLPVLADDREQYTAELHGKHYYAAKRGRLFVATSLTGGIALIVSATTGGHPTLWNPAGSGRNISIKRLTLGYVSGTMAAGSLAWNTTIDAGSVAATGSPILTFTAVAVRSALAGGAVDAKALWSPATNTFTAAPALYYTSGLSVFAALATTAVAPAPMEEDYDGMLNIAPGTALSLVSQQTTTTALFRVTVIFEEIDI